MADVEEVEVVVAHHERATLRVGDVFLKIDADQTRTDVEVEAMARAPIPTPEVVVAGYGTDVDLDVIRAWWSLRSLEPGPYHPWGLPWSGAGPEFTRAMGVDTSASPSLEEVMPVRRHHQQAVRETLENLTDAGLAEVRAAPSSPGHPTGEHSVLQCLHVLLNEEWEHHRYAVRDLDVLDPAGAPGQDGAVKR